MTAPEIELHRTWHRLAGHRHDDVIDGLLARHREPHRRYHTATHVMWVCRTVDELHDGQPVDDLLAVQAAALFHDAVYDPRSSTNEVDSAGLAQRELAGIGWPSDRCSLVTRLILATARHVATDHPEAVLLDADLAVLGSDAVRYAHYVTGVRAEYGHVDDAAWRVGRSSVLQSFLDQPYIYATPMMRTRSEARARANLIAELSSLRDT